MATPEHKQELNASRLARGVQPKDMKTLEDLDDEMYSSITVPQGSITVLWTIQTSAIIIVMIAVGCACWKMQFVMVPMLMAYFYTYMMGPFMDLLEKRPYGCFGPCGKVPEDPSDWEELYGSKMLCISGYEDEKRAIIIRRLRKAELLREHHGISPDEAVLAAAEITLIAKAPHMLACALVLLGSFGTLGFLGWLIKFSFNDFAEMDRVRTSPCDEGVASTKMDPCGEKGMADAIYEALNNMVNVELPKYGVTILNNTNCAPNEEKIAMMMEADANSNMILNTYVYGFYQAESIVGEYTINGYNTNGSCDTVMTFPQDPDGTPMAEMLGTVGTVGVILNDLVLELLLAIFILLERPVGSTFKADHKVMFRIENMVKNYISLKTLLSLGTGIVVGFFLVISSVKLALIWGLLAFLLNYIPNVGSAIAMVLPLPFILLDETLAGWQMAVGIGGMSATEMYVGNALEPGMFGEALNLTAISVLLSLVFCSYLWGLKGAVLSVPLLGVWKIVASSIDHPIAKGSLKLIRESPEVDVMKDNIEAEFFKRLEALDARLDELFDPAKAVDLEVAEKAEKAPKEKKEKKKKGDESEDGAEEALD
jgi:predicted PurR-regulated permease PerM